MAQTSISIRIDSELKRQFEAFCNDVGMTMTTAFNLFAKSTVRNQRIPFDISTQQDPFYSRQNMERLKASIAQMEAGGGTVHEVLLDD